MPSLFSSVRGFIGTVVKNPVTSLAVAYIIYQILKKYSPQKEGTEDLSAESVNVKHLPDGTDVITDTKSGAKAAVKGTRIIPLEETVMTREHAHRFRNLLEALGQKDAEVAASFPLDEFKAGLEEETEHTDDPIQAARIVLDHLTEDKEYYTKLAKADL